jgi:pimeloyl-ACP methyl ester carboxylesterase
VLRLALPMAAVVLLALPPAASADTPSLGPLKHVRVGAIDIGYRQGGSGPPMVLITGRGATMAEWDPRLLRVLMRHRRITVFDNRGVANTSDTPGDDLTAQEMAGDTYGLMKRLKIKRADVMAWSMGGYVAQELTLMHPDAVRRLVLCASNAGGVHYAPPSASVQALLDSPDLTTQELFSLSFPTTTVGTAGKDAYVAAVAAQPGLTATDFTLTDQVKVQQENVANAWKASNGGSYNRLPSIKQRTLVGDGLLDELSVVQNSRVLASRIPNATLKVYPDAGHAFLFQDPTRWGSAVVKFLETR